MEIFGLHEYIRDVTRRLAKLGAFAVAPDYYFRKGDLTKITEMPALFPLVNAKTDNELFADLDATVAWAKSQGGDTDRLGIMGFCRGGRTVWRYSTHNPNLKAGVAFYGSLADPGTPKRCRSNAIDSAAQVKEPVLGLYGAEDQGIPVDQVNQMKAALAEGRQDRRVQDLSRRAARLPRRLPAELPQGSGRRRLEADDRLVQEVQSAVVAAQRSHQRWPYGLAANAANGAGLKRPRRSHQETRSARSPSGENRRTRSESAVIAAEEGEAATATPAAPLRIGAGVAALAMLYDHPLPLHHRRPVA